MKKIILIDLKIKVSKIYYNSLKMCKDIIFRSSNKSIFIILFFYDFFSHIQKYLKIYQLNIIKTTKKDYKKG